MGGTSVPELLRNAREDGDKGLARHDAVVLKGSREGVAIIIHETASIDVAVRDLREKLKNAGSFFQGAVFRLEAGNRLLSQDERQALSSTVEEFGVALRDCTPQANEGVSEREEEDLPCESPRQQGEEETLFIRRTIRSGQRVEHHGNIVIMGDVNPGAVVMCSGDIVVLGTLRGLAHAGAEGNTKAIVMAFRLQPTQLRIAHYISRAPDEVDARPDVPEVARVRNDTIQIEAYVP